MVDALRQRRNFMLLYIIKKHNAAYRKLKVAHERTSINLILEMAATVRRRAATVCSCGARPRAAPSTHLAQAVAHPALRDNLLYRRFPIGRPSKDRVRPLAVEPAGLETCETADLEICGTKKPFRPDGCI
jgi:hypothetical protein